MDGGVSKQTVKQLFESVKTLCAAVVLLTNDMKHMMETVGQSYASSVYPTVSEALRFTIREEVKEMEEEDKEESSIVLKGLEVPSGREFVEVYFRSRYNFAIVRYCLY